MVLLCAATVRECEHFPQSWNAYAYVSNLPLANVDPLGLDDCNWHLDPGGGTLTCPYGGGSPLPPPGAPGGPGDPTGCGRRGGYCPGSGGGWPAPPGTPAPPAPRRPSIVSRFGSWLSRELACTDRFADKYSAAGGLHAMGVGNGGGTGTLITDSLAGNPISQLLEGRVAEAPATALALSGTRFGLGGEGIIEEGIGGTAVKAASGGSWSWATGAGSTFQTLFSGEVSMASTGVAAADVASGVGLALLGYDVGEFAVGLAACWEP